MTKTKTTHHDDAELVERAMRAYFRSARSAYLDQDQPSGGTVEVRDGVKYVELENGYRTLAVYRVAGESQRLLREEL